MTNVVGLLTKWKSCLLLHKAYGHQNWQDVKDLVQETAPTNSYASLITWPYEIMWQIKSLISLFLQDGVPPNFTGLWLTVRGSHTLATKLSDHMIAWGHVANYIENCMTIETYWCGKFIGSYEVWSSQEIFC